jgi:hypothetical protein
VDPLFLKPKASGHVRAVKFANLEDLRHCLCWVLGNELSYVVPLLVGFCLGDRALELHDDGAELF